MLIYFTHLKTKCNKTDFKKKQKRRARWLGCLKYSKHLLLHLTYTSLINTEVVMTKCIFIACKLLYLEVGEYGMFVEAHLMFTIEQRHKPIG